MTMTATNESVSAQAVRRLPHLLDAPAHDEKPVDPEFETTERNPLFELMVENESDVTGLLAYGLYKQNKRDWMIAFQAREGRQPTAAELDAFILGERIPRRTATYRRLAEDMLVKEGNRAGLLTGLIAQPANDTARTHAAIADAARKPITWRYIGFLLAMLVVMAVIFRLAASWLFGTGR